MSRFNSADITGVYLETITIGEVDDSFDNYIVGVDLVQQDKRTLINLDNATARALAQDLLSKTQEPKPEPSSQDFVKALPIGAVFESEHNTGYWVKVTDTTFTRVYGTGVASANPVPITAFRDTPGTASKWKERK